MNKQKTILIFDDDENILELCMIILSQKGYKINTYMDVNSIIEKTAEYKPDIIFIDNWIPDIGGAAATQLLKNHEEYRDIPVIYFSANNDIKSLAEKAGADGYLEKPFNIKDLEDIVVRHLKSSK